MKNSVLTLLIAVLISGVHVLAWPAMAKHSAELSRRLAQGGDIDTVSRVVIGDLATVGPITPVGTSLYNILKGTEDGYSDIAGYTPPGKLNSAACRNDTCCVWSYVAQALTIAFTGPTGRCNAAARSAIRLGFHDAGPWSSSLAAAGQDFGGADGSIVLSGSEINRADNNGLQSIVQQAAVWSKLFNVGVADLIQFAAKHAIVTCPLGPRLRVFVGRKDSSKPAPTGLMPSVTQSADTLINLFQDKTIIPHDLAALLGAHSASQQFLVNTTLSGFYLDSTPGVWDVNFYNETLQPNALPHVFRFQSDMVLAVDSRTTDEWRAFVGAQSHWNEDFAAAYVRVSMLGVNNMNNLTECTQVMPAAKKTFAGSNTPGLLG
ncbi:hypothetical protein MBLNU459_g5012t1 [Dothideomycetes sp. NU459]